MIVGLVFEINRINEKLITAITINVGGIYCLQFTKISELVINLNVIIGIILPKNNSSDKSFNIID